MIAPDAALRIADVFACVRCLADTAASLPLVPYVRSAGGERERFTGRLADLITRPAASTTTANLVGTLVAHLNLHGNAYLGKYRDERGTVVQLAPIAPQSITVELVAGAPRYTLLRADGVSVHGPEDVLHIRALSTDGLLGLSPIRQAAQALGLSRALATHADGFARNAGRPGGIMSIKDYPGNEEDVMRLKDGFHEKFTGENAGRVMVLTGEIEYQQLALSMADAQFVAQRQLSTAEVARVFRVPPWMVGAQSGDSLTYATVEGQAQAFVTFSLSPWLTLIEQAISADADLLPARRLLRVPARRAASRRRRDPRRRVRQSARPDHRIHDARRGPAPREPAARARTGTPPRGPGGHTMTRSTRPTCGSVEDRHRPELGDLEQRAAPTGAPTMDGPRLRGLVPYGVESRDLGGWREVIEPGALRNARLDDLVATVDHGGVPIARHPGTLQLEDRSDGMHWSLELPESRSDVREAVTRGDLCAGSWRMVVARDEWRGNVRHVHEVAELRDVSVVSSPAYSASVVEHRSAPDAPPAGPTPGPAQRTGGLRVEDRAQQSGPTLESRVISALRSVNLGEARSLTTTNADAIVPDDQGTFVWDRLRSAAVMLGAGIRVVPTGRDSVVWPRITADVQPDFYAETELIAAGDPTFGTLEAKPRKLAHRVELSNEVIDDSSPAIVDVLNAHLLGMLALKLDAAILEGNPASNPDSIRGLKYTPGIQTISMGTNGGTLTNYDPLLAAVGLLRGANVNGPLVAVAHPRTVTALALLKEATGSSKALESPAGAPTVVATSQLSTTETKGTSSASSSVYVFAPSEVVLVRRQDATIELDRSRLFDRDMSELRAKARADLIVPNPVAVVRIDGITAA